MAIIEHSGVKIELDDEGYLTDPSSWSPAVARLLAGREKVGELTQERLDIIMFMREYYLQHNAFPLLRGVCRRVNHPGDCYSETFLAPLVAWKIAGLPKPDEHVIGEIKGEGGVV